MSDKGDGADAAHNEEEDFAKSYPNINEELKEEIDDFFDIFDKDRDQFINYFDLTSLLRWLKFNPTETEMKKYIEKYDPAKSNLINKKVVYEIVNKKVLEPDTIEELIEAMKILDYNKDGTIDINELRWAMTRLGDSMEETAVDEMIQMITEGGDKKDYVEIMDFAETCFGVKENKKKKWPLTT